MAQPAQMIARAVDAFQQLNYAKAEKFALKALKKDPRNADLLVLIGMCCVSQDKLKGAVHYLERALAIAPEQTAALSSIGIAYIGLERYKDAITPLTKAQNLGVDDVETTIALGQAMAETGDKNAALALFQSAIPYVSGNPFSAISVGRFLRELGDFDQSLSVLTNVIQEAPDIADGHAEYAYTCRDLAKLDDGLKAIEQAIALDPADPRYHHNHAIILRYLVRFEEALAASAEGLRRAPNDEKLMTSQSVNLFLLERYEEAWPYFEARLHDYPGTNGRPLLGRSWDGSPLNGRRLLIRAELGIGDEILLSTCLGDAAEDIGTESVTIECDHRIKDILQRAYPEFNFIARVHKREDWHNYGAFDIETALGSLLPIYRPTVIDIESATPRQLTPKPELLSFWEQEFAKLGNGLKIGIAWRGGVTPLSIKSRSVTLEEMRPILSVPNCHFINLQYGDVAAEIDAFTTQHGIDISDWPDVDPLTDLEMQTAQIAALDLVIQVSNASAHIAGAIGQKTWVLQAAVPFWPWFAHRTDMPWYFDVTQYRMTDINDKSEVISQIARDLTNLTESDHTGLKSRL